MTLQRRTLLFASSLASLVSQAAQAPATGAASTSENTSARAARYLRAGGCVIIIRHALAPGTFDPPGFALGRCSTQRNLSEEGREQARQMGGWFRQHALVPSAVHSSPWCRCLDTARLAFGAATPWDALASPVQTDAATRARQLQTLQQALRTLRADKGHFQAWVTHQFVMTDLAQVSVASGEALVVQANADASGAPVVLAQLLLT